MRNSLGFVVILAMMAGCNQSLDEETEPEGNPITRGVHGPTGVVTDPNAVASGGGRSGGNQPNVHAPTGVVTNPGRAVGGGGSGGAVQAVRGAVGRVIDMKDMKDLHLYINQASLASGRMPTAQQIYTSVQQAKHPGLLKALNERTILLTDTRQRESIWAFTAQPQGGSHIVITQQGVERVDPNTLGQRLRAQGYNSST